MGRPHELERKSNSPARCPTGCQGQLPRSGVGDQRLDRSQKAAERKQSSLRTRRPVQVPVLLLTSWTAVGSPPPRSSGKKGQACLQTSWAYFKAQRPGTYVGKRFLRAL